MGFTSPVVLLNNRRDFRARDRCIVTIIPYSGIVGITDHRCHITFFPNADMPMLYTYKTSKSCHGLQIAAIALTIRDRRTAMRRNILTALACSWLTAHAASVDLKSLLLESDIQWASDTVISFSDTPEFEDATVRWNSYNAPTYAGAISPADEEDVVKVVRGVN